MSKQPTRRVRFVESIALAPDTKHFVFDALDGPMFDFEPGQYVCLLKSFNGETARRYYSIASAPQGSGRFELCIRPVPDESPFGSYLAEMQPGDELACIGPGGTFRLACPVRDSLCLAAGTGITPLRAMLRHLFAGDVDRGGGHSITLLFGARDEDRLYFREEFEDLERRWPNFRFLPTLSRAGNGWRGRRGHVQAHLDETLEGRAKDIDVYLCGPRAMVADVRGALAQRGFDEQAVLHEKW